MADSIDILGSGASDYGNVSYSLHGTTPIYDGWQGGRVPLESQKKSAGVDVSAYSTLKLTLTLSDSQNRHGYEHGLESAARLYVTLEHLVGGAWKELHRFAPVNAPQTQHAVLSAFGDQVRASWYFARPGDPTSTIRDEVAITWSLTAEATPEAA